MEQIFIINYSEISFANRSFANKAGNHYKIKEL